MTKVTASPRIEAIVADGFAGYRLINDRVSLTVLPQLGGKILDLRDLRSGRNWLQRNSFVPLKAQDYGASYLREGDSGGWDECFPTVAECAMPGHPGTIVPDHGELWPQPWNADKVRSDHDLAELSLSAEGRLAPYVFSRKIALHAGAATIQLDYEVHNRGATDLPFIWSAHPILDLLPGSTIALPKGIEFALHVAFPDLPVSADGAVALPFEGRVMGNQYLVGPLPGPEVGQAIKVWSTSLPEGWARLIDPSGSSAIEFRFDLAQVPDLGLWINLGGWAGRPEAQGKYYCVAIEPCIGAQDRLDDAVTRHNRFGLLKPDERRSWSVTVDLDPEPRLLEGDD